MATSAWTVLTATGNQTQTVRARFRLTPKSSRDRIDGLTTTADGPAIKARVRAIPEGGAANKALQIVTAKWLAMPRSSITLSAGAKSRTKVLTIIASASDIARIVEQFEQLSKT